MSTPDGEGRDLLGKPPDQEQPNRVAKYGDPTGRLDIFDSAGFPSIHDATNKVFEYVEGKALSIGTKISRNRGLPPHADPRNMLSLEEKAICILGRAVGLAWSEVEDRIVGLRLERGEEPPQRDFWQVGNGIYRRHSDIVSEIQADLLEACEAFMPLVGGTHRFIWRSKVLEVYRRRMIELAKRTDLDEEEWEKRFSRLDRAMRPHMKWLDEVMKDQDIKDLLSTPAEKMREQVQSDRVKEINRLFEDGEIDDAERIERLREARHGE